MYPFFSLRFIKTEFKQKGLYLQLDFIVFINSFYDFTLQVTTGQISQARKTFEIHPIFQTRTFCVVEKKKKQ